MYKILVLLVFSFISLFGKEFPLSRKINLTISNHTTTVLEFPFKITEKRFDSFKKVSIINKTSLSKDALGDSINSSLEIPTIKTESKIINGQKVIVKKRVPTKKTSKKAPISITTSENGNIMELKPNLTGTIKVIVWGFKYYPVMININVEKDDNSLTDYFKFVDYETPKDEVVKFESSKHEIVVKKLLTSAYLGKTPKGYTKDLLNNEVKIEDYTLVLNSIIKGKNYQVKSYDFINTSKEPIKLHERMFYKEGLVYSVSIEKINKYLNINEKTRIFVVEKGI
jgi:hypothetical protein